jgi:hypothetical protein
MFDVAPSTTRAAVSMLGFRRVDFVRLIVDEDGTTAEVTGITHRLPRTIRVPLRTATALIDAGVPSRIEARRQTHLQRQVG